MIKFVEVGFEMFFLIWAVVSFHINMEGRVVVDEKLLREQEKLLDNCFKLRKNWTRFQRLWNNCGTASSCAFLKYSDTTSVFPQTKVPQDTPLSNLREWQENISRVRSSRYCLYTSYDRAYYND
jgi:hypothetical protein